MPHTRTRPAWYGRSMEYHMQKTDDLTCGLVEASCRCILIRGHEGPHECQCEGSWDFDDDGEFILVSLPNPETSPFLTD